MHFHRYILSIIRKKIFWENTFRNLYSNENYFFYLFYPINEGYSFFFLFGCGYPLSRNLFIWWTLTMQITSSIEKRPIPDILLGKGLSSTSSRAVWLDRTIHNTIFPHPLKVNPVTTTCTLVGTFKLAWLSPSSSCFYGNKIYSLTSWKWD